MSQTPKELTAEAGETATAATDATDATLSPTISVANVYQYKPADKYVQAAKKFRPDPVKYKFLRPETPDSATPQDYSTVAREKFLGLINQYNVEKNFGEGSLRDGKPCLIKAFEKLSFADFDAIRESIKNQKGKTDPLVEHLETLDKKKFKSSTFNPSEVQSMVAILKDHKLLPKIQQKRSVNLTELLGGKENLKVFKAALAEEVNSPEFLKALWEHSLKPHYGVKDPNTFAIQIMSGASGSGKSFAGDQAVNRQYPVEGTPDPKKPTFWMAWVDGGIARDINVTQQYVKLLSFELGVEVDLYKDSKEILEPTKGKVKEAIIGFAKEAAKNGTPLNIGIVEPLTYSSDVVLGDVPKAITEVKKLSAAFADAITGKSIDLSYDYVSGNDFEGHAEVVKTQGENRAFPTTDQAKSDFETMNSTTPSVPVGEAAAVENSPSRLQRFKDRIPSIRFAENKEYGPGGYQFGVNGSVNGFIEYEKAFGDGQSGVTLSRHINCNDLRVFTIDGELWDAKKHSGKERHVFSERLVADWKASKEASKGSLIDYASKNRSNSKYSNFMTNFNPKDLKFGLSSEVEKIFQSNFQKKASLVSVSPNNLGYLVPFLNILDRLHQNNLGYLVPFLNILDRLHQTKGEKEAYNDPEQIKGLIAELSQLIAEKRKENLGKKLNPFVTSNTLPLMEKTLQKLIKREALLTRKHLIKLQSSKPENAEQSPTLEEISQLQKELIGLNQRYQNLLDEEKELSDSLNTKLINLRSQLEPTIARLETNLVKKQRELEQELNPTPTVLANLGSIFSNSPPSPPPVNQTRVDKIRLEISSIQSSLKDQEERLKAPGIEIASKKQECLDAKQEIDTKRSEIEEMSDLFRKNIELNDAIESLFLGVEKEFVTAPLYLSQAITGYIEQLQSRKESFSDKASETANSETILGSDGSTAAETLSETSSRVSIEDVSERDEVKSTISSSAETAPETLSVSDSELVSGISGDSLKGLLINPEDASKVHYPFSQKLYDLSLERIQGDDHKNAKYLIALNQIIARINPDDEVSIEQGIALLNQLEAIKSENKKGLSFWRSNTSQLIDEVKSYFETRLEVVKTFDVTGEFEAKIKKIDEELNEQLKPEPVKGSFLTWAEKVIKSFIDWLASKKEISASDLKSTLTALQKCLTIGLMFHVLINFVAHAFSSKSLDSPLNTTEKFRSSISERNQVQLIDESEVDNTRDRDEPKTGHSPQ